MMMHSGSCGSVQARQAVLAAVMAVGSIVAACTNVSDITQPSCTFDVTPVTMTVGPSGGPGSVTISAPGVCEWRVNTQPSWVTFKSPTSGTGDGTLSFDVAANPSPATRNGGVSVAGRTISITQAATSCTYSVSPEALSIGAGGGTRTVTVTATGNCPWSAVSNAAWLTVTAGQTGAGNGTVTLTAAANGSASSRETTVTIAGRSISVSQDGQSAPAPGPSPNPDPGPTPSPGPSPGPGPGPTPTPPPANCTYQLSATGATVSASGGVSQVQVTTQDGCPWTSVTNSSWITVIAGVNTTGSGTAAMFSEAHSGLVARSGTVTVAGQAVTITQQAASGSGCSLSANAPTTSYPAGGGNGTIAVTAGAGCAWAAESGVSWITLTGGTTGTGNGTVNFTVAPNTTTASRTAQVAVGNQTVTITQAGQAGSTCSYTLAPGTTSYPAGGGSGSIGVATTAQCAWTASSSAAWITITSGAAGSGNGSVGYTVAANTTTTARTGSLTVAGQTVTITQAATAGPTCTYSVSPTTFNLTPAAQTQSVTLTTTSGCAWTATSSAPWLTIANGSASGTGSSSVQFSVTASAGTFRTATLTIGGQTVTVNQAP